MIDAMILGKVKTHLRIKHDALDMDVCDWIDACISDLSMCGVKSEEYCDPLILNAIKLYCKANYTDDTSKSAEYMKRYEALKSSLMMAGGYRQDG